MFQSLIACIVDLNTMEMRDQLNQITRSDHPSPHCTNRSRPTGQPYTETGTRSAKPKHKTIFGYDDIKI